MALDTMRDIEFYRGRFPSRKTQIAKHRHLQFHIEAFFHELYILQQRLLQLLKFIERQHRRDPRLQAIKTPRSVLNTFVIDSMKKGIAIRGSHVHRSPVKSVHWPHRYLRGKRAKPSSPGCK